ncbi:hypothetical protein F5Y19DRAFT_485419 [Xylariaceae sp. FL1651]|nr:hypothetical protein F5Y19DRAFT_485419 [Xylariaceae sp. FL1651]
MDQILVWALRVRDVTMVMVVLSTVFVALRFLARKVQRLTIGIDDYLILAAGRVILATASKPYDVGAPKSSMNYFIVIEETPFQEGMARVLGRALESTAVTCTTCYLDQLNSTVEEDPKRTLIFVPELERSLLQNLSPARFSRLRNALVSTKGLLWLAGRDENGLLPPNRALADGLTRVLRSENEEAVIVTAALAHLPIPDQAAQILTLTVFEKSVPYHSKVLPFGEAPPLRLAIGTPGSLDTLYFDEDMSTGEPVSQLGNTPFKIGDRVCLMSPAAFSTFTRAKAEHVAKVPDEISLQHAAGVPVQFVTAWHAIHNAARAQKGCDIFATVGSDEKERFLIEHYGVAEDRIFYSRSTAFAQQILRLTNGRGVDIVINSLSGDGLLASWDIIAPQGRFVELGKKDIAANNTMAADHGGLVKKIIDQLMDKFVAGSLRPVENFQTLPVSHIQEGMGILQSGQSTGKIVFDMAKDAPVPVSTPFVTLSHVSLHAEMLFEQARIRTQSSWRLGDTKTYVIAGGTVGLGLKIAEWMKGGAGVAKVVSKLREQGAVVEAPRCDSSNINALRGVVDKYRGSMPPIHKPKTRGSWNLHTVIPKGLDFFVLLSSIAGIVGSAGQANYAAGNTYMDALAHYRNALGERAVALDLGAILDHGVLAANEALRDRIISAGLLRGVYSSKLLALLDHYYEIASHPRDAVQVAIGLATASGLGTSSAPGPRTLLSLPFYRHAFAGAGGSKSANGEQGSTGDDSPEAQQRRIFASAEVVSDAGVLVSRALLRRPVDMTPGLRNRIPAEDEDKYPDELVQNFGVDSLQAIGLRSCFAREFAADVPIFVILGDETLASIGLWVAGRSRLR